MAAEKGSRPVKTTADLPEAGGQYPCQRPSGDPGPGRDPWAGPGGATLSVWETSMRIFGARQILHSLPAEFDGTTPSRGRGSLRRDFLRNPCLKY
jgi:hypothetical protein